MERITRAVFHGLLYLTYSSELAKHRWWSRVPFKGPQGQTPPQAP